jgi:hypothetical protein
VFSGGDGTAGSANTAIRFFCNAGPYIEGAVVRDCTFETIASGTAATAAQKQSIFFTALLLQDCNDFVVEGCSFNTTNTNAAWASISDTGQAHASGGVIRDNGVENCSAGFLVHYNDDVTIGGWGHGNHIHDGHGFGASAAFGSLNCDIIGNRIHDLTRSVGDSLWNGIDVSGGATGRILHNTVHNVVRHCVTLAADNGGAGEFEVVNNVLDASENTEYTASDYRRPCVADRTGDDVLTEHHNILHAFLHAPVSLVTNGYFTGFTGTADDGSADTFTGWTLNTGTLCRFEALTTANTHLSAEPAGTKGMGIICPSGASGTMQARTTAIALTAAAQYTVKVRAKWEQIHATPADCGVRVSRNGNVYLQDDGVTWNTTVNDVLSMNVASMTDYSFAFTPDTSTNYTVHLFPTNDRGSTYVTKVEVFAGVPLEGRLVASTGADQGTMYDIAGWQGLGFGVSSVDEDPDLDANDVPQAGSPAIDTGVVIAGVNDGYSDAAPDMGAVET